MASIFDLDLCGKTILPRNDKTPEAKAPSIPLSGSSSTTFRAASL